MVVSTILQEPRVIDIFNRVLPSQKNGSEPSYIEVLMHKILNNDTQEFYVPVLGIQGTGKSSFLNALLMDELILPVDADETTCVPVEVRYGKKGEPITVHFDQKPPVRITDPKQLEQYVHNDYNPGNEKGVTSIQVFKDHPLLQNGVVFVDLPGVGSLTAQNIKTTMDYIEKLSAAIFMLRTVPPITKQEANFLKAVWPKLAKAWFIQNQWNDESQDEVKDGKAHNIRVLEDIRNAHQMNHPIDVRIINVYSALKGQLTNDNQLRKKSGLAEFEALLSTVSSSWSTMLQRELKELMIKAFTDVQHALQKEIGLYSKKPEEHYESLRREEEELEQVIDENNKILRALEQMVVEQEQSISTTILQLVRQGKESLRADMQRIVNANVVDGERLTKAFEDCQRDVTDDVIEAYIDILTEFKMNVEERFNHLQVRDADGSFDVFEKFSKEEKIKLEKGLPTLLSLGAGAAVLLLASNPVGWAALGVTLLATTVAGWFGKKVKEVTQESRQRQTMEQLQEPINSFSNRLEQSLLSQFNEFVNSIRATAKKIKNEQNQQLEAAYDEQRRIRFMEIEEYDAKLRQLEDDLAYIQSLGVNV
ncbi:dynamin family protein [Neobacillus vireti]|uniref:dynamin family protein n=1 Tax=Neobacillus vireti TaxID=220686 RepID=UPI0030004688